MSKRHPPAHRPVEQVMRTLDDALTRRTRSYEPPLGQNRMAVVVVAYSHVELEFHHPCRRITMHAAEARQVAAALLEAASELDGKKSS